MRNLLLVTNNFYAPLYLELQTQYAVRFMAQVTTLRQAAALLQPNGGQFPEVVMLGHDLSPAGQVVEFVRKAQSNPAMRKLRFVALLDQNAAFLAGELTGIAETLVFQHTTAETLAGVLNADPVRVSRTTALTVVNVKGGTGKTSLLVNLAATLAGRGYKTAVLDADVVDGNIGQALGVSDTAETVDRLAADIGRGQDANAALSRYLSQRSKNLFVLPAPGRSDFGHDHLNEVTAGAIFNAFAAHRFDLVLVDLPGNVRATPFIATLAAYPAAYFYLLYPTDRAFGQKGFSGAAQIVHGLSAGSRGRIVVYQNGDSPWTETEMSGQWGLPVAGVIPHEPLVEQCQRTGQTAAEFIAAQSGLLHRARQVIRRGPGQAYLAAIDQLAGWIVAHDLTETA